MRKNLLVTCLLIAAACSEQTPPTGPSEIVVTRPAASRALEIAVNDAVDRLLPGLATDAAEPIGGALRVLTARLHVPTTDASAVQDALDRTLRTIDQLRATGRSDAAMLDALRLELDVAR